MYTWNFYEFHDSVNFPGIGPTTRVLTSDFARVVETPREVVFVSRGGQVRGVDWTNIRYRGGCLTPQVEPSPAEDAAKAPKKLRSSK